MGSVAMGAGGSYFFDGYTVTQTAYCLYCDRCGSFDIKCPLHLPTWIAFFLIPVVVGLIGAAGRGVGECGMVALMMISVALLFWLTTDSFKHRYHICKKCGNADINGDNVRQYPEYDRSVLDVPYEATIKYYIED